MKQLQKFNTEHLTTLCTRGISVLIVFSLTFNIINNCIIIGVGVTPPFQDSQFAKDIFLQRLLSLCIAALALLLQTIYLFKPIYGKLTKITIILLLVSFGLSLNLQNNVKQLSYNQQAPQQQKEQQCITNAYKLWPNNSQELVDQANKLDCTQGCPCTTNQSNQTQGNALNFQTCIMQDQSQLSHSDNNIEKDTSNIGPDFNDSKNINSNINNQSKESSAQIDSTKSVSEQAKNKDKIKLQKEQEQTQNQIAQQRLLSMQKLSEIEQTLQCGGICFPTNTFLFWDVTQQIQQTSEKTNCYEIAAKLLQNDVLIPTKNQSITLIFIIIFTLIQEVFISKPYLIIQFAKLKLGACISLPITRLNTSTNGSESTSALEQKQNISTKTTMKIQLIDLTKKAIKNKENKLTIEIKKSPQLLKSDSNSPNNGLQTPQIQLVINQNYFQQNEN